ncbi:MAG: hypothetical protein GQ527_04025, partial [Bacteroidales bacterium]|nr:hypothetical protein [Bacteroidales bacterium]
MKNLITYLLKLGFWFLAIIFMVSCSSSNENQQGRRKKIVKDVDTTQIINNDTKFVFTETESIHKNTINESEIEYYDLDTEKSILTWFCVTHTGYVKFKEGRVGVVKGEIVSANFEICMDSIADTDIDYMLMREVLVNTLKSPDFFDIGKFPTSTFSLSHLKKEKGSFYQAAGDLRIRDITHQINFKSTIVKNDSLMMMISERFSIDRTLWDITIYSENYEQTDDSFLFTDMVEFQVSL